MFTQLTAWDQLSDTSDMVRVDAGAGFVELGRNKEGKLIAFGDVVAKKTIVLSRTGREVLTPGHGRGTTKALSIKKRNQDFVSSFRRCHD